MHKIITVLSAFLFLSVFTGCIEVIEELTVTKDGKGHYRKTMDMSQLLSMKEMLGGAAKEGTDSTTNSGTENSDNPAESIAKEWYAIKNMEGLSNVTIDTAGYVFTLNYDFESETALNKAIAAESKDSPQANVYNLSGKSVSRTGLGSTGDLLGEGEDDENMEMMKTFFSDMKYKLVINLPGRVKSVSNKKATIENNKTVKLETNLKDLVEKTSSLEMKIDFKN